MPGEEGSEEEGGEKEGREEEGREEKEGREKNYTTNILDKVVELVGGGSVINGAYPV